MGKGPFKMKGSPMQRNFGVGSPLHKGTSTKGKLKAAWQTAKEVGSSDYDIGDASKNYKANKALVRKAKAEGGTPNFETMKVDKT